MAQAGILYKVQGPGGVYYAIYDPQTARLWTERSADAGRAQAKELGLTLASEKSVTHHELMRLVGRDARLEPNPISTEPSDAPVDDRSKVKSQSAGPPIRSSAPFTLDAGGPEVIVSKSDQGASIFSSSEPVAPPTSDEAGEAGDIMTGDIVSGRKRLPKGMGRSPFADRNKPGRRS